MASSRMRGGSVDEYKRWTLNRRNAFASAGWLANVASALETSWGSRSAGTMMDNEPRTVSSHRSAGSGCRRIHGLLSGSPRALSDQENHILIYNQYSCTI